MIKVNTQIIQPEYFPDKTLKLNAPDLYVSKNFISNIEFEWKFENNEEMIILYYLVNHYRNKGFSNFYLRMPYVPNARMDRVKESSEVFTLKYFCDFINSLNFKQVMIFDPHSNVTSALLNNVVQKDFYYYETCLRNLDFDIVFFPDEGAMKRYNNIFNKPYSFGIKHRDWKTGKIEKLEVSNADIIKNKNILIFDDICSKGGTFYFSAKRLKELGANKIYLFVSHCEDTILDGDLINSGLIEKIYTTNSIINKAKTHPLIEVIK